jgi:hypothetical protein
VYESNPSKEEQPAQDFKSKKALWESRGPIGNAPKVEVKEPVRSGRPLPEPPKTQAPRSKPVASMESPVQSMESPVQSMEKPAKTKESPYGYFSAKAVIPPQTEQPAKAKESPYGYFSAKVVIPPQTEQPAKAKENPYGKLSAKSVTSPDKVVVERPNPKGPHEKTDRDLPANGQVATGQFVSRTDGGTWIQKAQNGDLIHYQNGQLDSSAKSVLEDSMKFGIAVQVSTLNHKVVAQSAETLDQAQKRNMKRSGH